MNTITKTVNPLDALFDTLPDEIEPEVTDYVTTTEGTFAGLVSASSDQVPEPDLDDAAIDAKIDAVYDAALETFNQLTAYTEIIEPRYAARNAEVSANYLSIALSAALGRAKVKGDRKRNAQFVPFTGNKANGSIVASREDIMAMIAVDAEIKDRL